MVLQQWGCQLWACWTSLHPDLEMLLPPEVQRGSERGLPSLSGPDPCFPPFPSWFQPGLGLQLSCSRAYLLWV